MMFSGIPVKIIDTLNGLSRKHSLPVYVSGGTVRDLLLGRKPLDIDITIPKNAKLFIEEMQQQLGGTIVPLDTVEEVYRLVCYGVSIDCAVFREGTTTIEDDLLKRDFTINALAVPLEYGLSPVNSRHILDPSEGISDLRKGVLRSASMEAFKNDPLRLLRAFRFSSTLGFDIDPETFDTIKKNCSDITAVSAERISYELDQIIHTGSSAVVFAAMYDSGILGELFPQTLDGVGMEQPSSHHLDVFEHNLAALDAMDGIIANPEHYFPDSVDLINTYLLEKKRISWLKWAAFFHDIGKPVTRAIREDKGGRLTFYNHDRAGAGLFYMIASRYKWSNENSRETGRFIENHMWPFHLNNARKRTEITPRACLRLVKAMEEELPGLFILAMADSVASQGENRPEKMEEDLADLFTMVERIRIESIDSVLRGPRLITGKDLIDIFKQEPGPFFKVILDELENARVEEQVSNREEALLWVEQFIASRQKSH